MKNNTEKIALSAILVTLILTSCSPNTISTRSLGSSPAQNTNGITKLASRGRPVAQSIAWSPTEDNKILAMADAGMGGPGQIKVYIFDTKTGHKQDVVNTEGWIFNAGWGPNGESILIRTGEVTKGFEPEGWWLVNLEDKSAKYLPEYWKVSCAPDGKTLAVFTGDVRNGKMENIKLQLINVETDFIETIYDLPGSGYV
jgi:Tol biopolymer transport system component